jgi:WhiB family redox-sensing transcriptional regulator
VKARSTLEFSPGASGSLLAAEERSEADWQDAAQCATADPEAWFPAKGGDSSPAKRICMRCPVRQPCLEYALENADRFGIWGGKSERERRKILRDREKQKQRLAEAA